MLRAHLTPTYTCIHTLMHVHISGQIFTSSNGKSSSSKQQEPNTSFFFPWEITDLKPFQTLQYIWKSMDLSLCSKIGGIDTISRSHLWVKENNLRDLGISSKQSLSRTQEICFAVYQELQAAQEQIHLPFYFLPEKCRLSLLALLRVIAAATSQSVRLSVLITAVPLFHILSLLFFFFFCAFNISVLIFLFHC